ncbi:MAG: hypothetical protein HOE90_23960 [Bacteriovoracaceae bacterium]|jgi:predicted transcriptional regulator of viral defense system|nr:hypothetical protein [Bacteriovoracaceae bacterium]
MTNRIALGIGKLNRNRLSQVLRKSSGIFDVKEVACWLGITSVEASKILSYWSKNGWVKRLKRGLYIPVPLESSNGDIAVEEPWVLAEKLFRPCYIGGWSASEYLDLTEQIYGTVMIFTASNIKQKEVNIAGVKFYCKRVSADKIWGTKTEWRGKIKVLISDKERTIVDMLSDPKVGGGIRPVLDVLTEYWESEDRNIDKIKEYARKLENGVIFKRLGFLLEMNFPKEIELLEYCKQNISKGNSKLDSSLYCNKLSSKWNLWVPENWKVEKK